MSAELESSTRARRQMTADIAHELRTPLSLIIGHADAVCDGVQPASVENFEIIREEALRLEHLVEDLRTLSLADSGELSLELQEVSPEKLLRDIAASYQVRLGQKKLNLFLHFDPDLPAVMVDPGRLTQVVANILDNAIRHTPEDGQVALAATKNAAAVEIAIQDSGPGVPADTLERIFDRLYRVDPSRQRGDGGTGLGLSIARSIIELHGGRIWAEGAADHGLRIVISLPAKA
jgi:signal transduction histidine kinase